MNPAKDIVFWKNSIASIGIFFTGHILFYMLCRWHLSIALVIGRILLFQILLCFAYVVGMKVIAPNREIVTPSQFEISSENVREYLNKISDRVYEVLAWYVSVLLCKDFRVTIAVGITLELFNRFIAKKISVAAMSYIAFNALMILPAIYDIFEDEILNGISFVKVKGEMGIGFVQKKIEQFTSKKEKKEK